MGHVIWETELLQAQNPYYAELAGANIYNLEELNYFLQKYFYLIDNTAFNENLVAFLHTEMNRPDLGRIVYGNVGKNHPISIVSKLIIGIDRLWEMDAQNWREKAAEYQKLPVYRQKLLQADLLYERGSYDKALKQYEQLLTQVQEEQISLEKQEIARICYHLGRIAMESLSWKAAGAYLQKAYSLTGNQELLKELYMLTLMSPEIICDNNIFRDAGTRMTREWSAEYNQKKEALEAQKSLSHYEAMLQADLMGNYNTGARAQLQRWQEDFRKISKNSCQEMNSSV